MFRYSDRRIYGVLKETPAFYLYNLEDAADLQGFSQVVQGLLAELTEEAGLGDSKLKFSAGNVSYEDGDYKYVYGMVQCTPDMSQPQCVDCLQAAAGAVQTWSPGKIGARILSPNCYIRYEIYTFFDPTAVSKVSRSPPPPTPPSSPLLPPPLSPNITTNAEGSFSFFFS